MNSLLFRRAFVASSSAAAALFSSAFGGFRFLTDANASRLGSCVANTQHASRSSHGGTGGIHQPGVFLQDFQGTLLGLLETERLKLSRTIFGRTA